MMLQIRNPATWSCPTQNSVKRSPCAGKSGCRVASKAGAIRIRLPISRNSTKTSGGTSPSASFINGQFARGASGAVRFPSLRGNAFIDDVIGYPGKGIHCKYLVAVVHEDEVSGGATGLTSLAPRCFG